MTAPASSTGPFIVRHVEPGGANGGIDGIDPDRVLHREAVADLEAARSVLRELLLAGGVGEQAESMVADCRPRKLTDGQIYAAGPMSDGSVVEVEATTRERLIEDIRRDGGTVMGHEVGASVVVCAIWNARHGIEAKAGGGTDG